MVHCMLYEEGLFTFYTDLIMGPEIEAVDGGYYNIIGLFMNVTITW